MIQTSLSFDAPRARVHDPQTSHDAAEKAKVFQARHIALIYDALFVLMEATPREIARFCKLDYVAVQRRAVEMERKGLIVRGPDVRDGMKVWRVA